MKWSNTVGVLLLLLSAGCSIESSAYNLSGRWAVDKEALIIVEEMSDNEAASAIHKLILVDGKRYNYAFLRLAYFNDKIRGAVVFSDKNYALYDKVAYLLEIDVISPVQIVVSVNEYLSCSGKEGSSCLSHDNISQWIEGNKSGKEQFLAELTTIKLHRENNQ